MVRRALLCLLLLLVISGCSAQTGENEFQENIIRLEQAISDKDSVSVKLQVEGLLKVFQHNEWKLQMIGDEGEYERLNESIRRIIVAIEEEDFTEARIELSTTKTILRDIYSL